MTGKAKRRWFGGTALGLAVLMLILGQTVFNGRFTPATFLVYWITCFLLTIIAVVVALVDVRSVQRTVGRETRDLLDETLQDIEQEAKRRRRNNGRRNR